MDDWLSLQECSTLVRVTTDTLRAEIRDGRLRAFRAGKKMYRVRRADLLEWLRPVGPAEQAVR